MVTLKNSAFQNNWNNGVEIDHVNASYWPTPINTTFFGNDVGAGGDPNISVY
ncbi:MAG: hypothetical protein Q7J07_06570 [Pelolinea sp.]|nr:hypothetical protein [Pelolinea sp.]